MYAGCAGRHATPERGQSILGPVSGAFLPSEELAAPLAARSGAGAYVRLAGSGQVLVAPAVLAGMAAASGLRGTDWAALPRVLALGALAALLVSGATGALRQAAQVDTDRINNPTLPLCSGELGQARARWFAAGCGALALLVLAVLALSTGRWAALPVLLGWAVLRAAAVRPALRAWPVSGALAFAEGFSLACGGWLLAGPVAGGQPWLCAALAGLLAVGGLLLRDMAAQRGDAAYGIATLPAVQGTARAAYAAVWLSGPPFLLLPLAGVAGMGAPLDLAAVGLVCLLAGLRGGLLALDTPDDPSAHVRRHAVVTIFAFLALAAASVPYAAWGRWMGVLL